MDSGVTVARTQGRYTPIWAGIYPVAGLDGRTFRGEAYQITPNYVISRPLGELITLLSVTELKSSATHLDFTDFPWTHRVAE